MPMSVRRSRRVEAVCKTVALLRRFESFHVHFIDLDGMATQEDHKSELIDINNLSLADLNMINNPQFSQAIKRVVDETVNESNTVAKFNSMI